MEELEKVINELVGAGADPKEIVEALKVIIEKLTPAEQEAQLTEEQEKEEAGKIYGLAL